MSEDLLTRLRALRRAAHELRCDHHTDAERDARLASIEAHADSLVALLEQPPALRTGGRLDEYPPRGRDPSAG